MQIRLTVAPAPRGARGTADAGGGRTGPAAHPADRPQSAQPHPAQPAGQANVLVTAPAGTVLSAVTSALATSAAAALAAAPSASGPSGGSGPGGEAAGQEEAAQEPVVVYAGTRRLDPHRQIIGEPPLLDGALISLHAPVAPAALPAHGAAVTALTAYGSARARLHVTGGPDAGGIHLLQGGTVHLGRSAEADVPLDDPDVSRLHCAVTVTDGGTVTVTDLGSTNGTTVEGAPVGRQPVLLRPGGTLRIGETTVRLEAAARTGPHADTGGADPSASGQAAPLALPTAPDGEGRLRLVPLAPERPAGVAAAGPGTGAGTGTAASGDVPGPREGTARGAEHWGTEDGPGRSAHSYAPAASGGPFPGADMTHSAGLVPPGGPDAGAAGPAADGGEPPARRGRGLSAWARRLTARAEPAGPGAEPGGGSRHPDPDPHGPTRYGSGIASGCTAHPAEGFGNRQEAAADSLSTPPGSAKRWPDPASVLLSALGPGPRLWERSPDHPDALTVRLGIAHRSGGHGDAVTADLRRAGALGLAGPRARLAGLARSVLAQLTALHGPSALEVVLLSADPARSAQARQQEWAWLGWLPHLRPAHGQDCGLLTAYDHDQAAARTAELVRRLEAQGSAPRDAGARGPAAVVVVDGDPGSAALRASAARLAREGPAAGIHLLCLAETPPASPSSPLTATLEAADGACPGFAECGTVALLSGDVATAVKVLHPARRAAPHGTPERPHGQADQTGQADRTGRGGGRDGQAGRDRQAARDGGREAHAPRGGHAPRSGPSGQDEHSARDGHGARRGQQRQGGRAPAPAGAAAAAAAPGGEATAPGGEPQDRPGPAAAGGGPGAPGGPVATVDAVSAAWAERFARALAPLREPEGAGTDTSAAPTVTLPEQCRLLEELGLARATPAALLARWSERAAAAGRVPLVFGAGPHGPLEADLSDLSALPAGMAPAVPESGTGGAGRALPGHAFVSGGPGSGKSELLRSLAASLAAGERPDRLALVLVDGAGADAGDGLRVCEELPHTTARLTAGDPVRMRQFAQSLSAELKRRAELIGDESSFEEYVRSAARPSGRVVAPRQAPEREPVREAAAEPRAGEGVQVPAPARAPEERTAVTAQRPRGHGGGAPEDRAAGGSGAQGGGRPGTGGGGGGGGLEALPQQAGAPDEPAGALSAAEDGAARRPDPGDRSGQAGTGGIPEPEADGTRRTLRLRRTGPRPGEQPPADAGAASRPEAARAEAARAEAARAEASRTEGSRAEGARAPASRTDSRYAGGQDGDAAAPSLTSPSPLGPGGVPPRLVVLVDDFDTLVDPALGNPGRPAAGSVVRALEAVARAGSRLGVHVIAATGRADRTVHTAPARTAALHVELTGGERGAEGTPRGRGTLTLRQRRGPEGTVVGGVPVPFQAGRVTGRIPRTATLRPTVVPLDWARAGDPPARRQVRELGNGPTDLALLASAMERAARQVAPGAAAGPA
ncbi:FHA domain-containing protein [Streptomyces qinglanensis]|uniref:FHA domain-containing protein n=1 Tax=Streptomyces qinglanensis TaxID=943816 RepID=UPI003D70E8B9